MNVVEATDHNLRCPGERKRREIRGGHEYPNPISRPDPWPPGWEAIAGKFDEFDIEQKGQLDAYDIKTEASLDFPTLVLIGCFIMMHAVGRMLLSRRAFDPSGA